MQTDRRQITPLQLFSERDNLFFPIARRIKPGEVMGERGVVPAAREPGAIMYETQTAQGFDELDLGIVEHAEGFITFQQDQQLRRHLILRTR